jgi:hypothetical protein
MVFKCQKRFGNTQGLKKLGKIGIIETFKSVGVLYWIIDGDIPPSPDN